MCSNISYLLSGIKSTEWLLWILKSEKIYHLKLAKICSTFTSVSIFDLPFHIYTVLINSKHQNSFTNMFFLFLVTFLFFISFEKGEKKKVEKRSWPTYFSYSLHLPTSKTDQLASQDNEYPRHQFLMTLTKSARWSWWWLIDYSFPNDQMSWDGDIGHHHPHLCWAWSSYS